MQSRLSTGVLVLQSEGLVRRSRYVRFALQFAPTVIIPEPQQITVLIGHLARDADVVAVEVVGLLSAFLFRLGRVGFRNRIGSTGFDIGQLVVD